MIATRSPARVHEALIKKTLGFSRVGHISRDAPAIEAREKPVRAKTPVSVAPKRKRGRPKMGDVVAAKEPRRRERQASQTLPQMLADLPKCCNFGTKRNAIGQTTSGTGYKARSAGRKSHEGRQAGRCAENGGQ